MTDDALLFAKFIRPLHAALISVRANPRIHLPQCLPAPHSSSIRCAISPPHAHPMHSSGSQPARLPL
jgi:hypothetical protein